MGRCPDRGVSLAVMILTAFVAGMQYVATRTLFGRHVFTVGGNAEAARRAGIHTNRIRVIVFAISGAMAAIGGVLAASRLLAVDQSTGGSDLLLFAIAGPVIAGTSLFGGRGSVWSALLGATTIGSISNGMTSRPSLCQERSFSAHRPNLAGLGDPGRDPPPGTT